MRVLTAIALMGVLVAGYAAGPETDPGRLEGAREELRLRVATERRMREEFESLLAGGRMSAQEIADFESYLARLGELVDAQRRTVAALGGDVESPPPQAALPADFERGHTDDETLAKLDAELGNSLSEFDDELLREQKEIAEKSRSVSASGDGDGLEGLEGGSGEASQGGGESGDQSSDARAGSDGQSGGAGGEGAEQQVGTREGDADEQAPGEAGREGAEGGERVASAGGENSGSGSGRASPPPDIPDGADDDIVARQLREAAENEEDPELREKLWEEYRKYKEGTR